MVIDENGGQLGLLKIQEALDMAQEKEMDLVEVSPLANPPVCKIIDYGKFQYQQSRSQQKAKKIETKVIRLSLGIGQHDLEVKKKQAIKFLDQGHNVKIELRLKGREKAFIFKDKAKGVIKQFLESLGLEYKMDKNIEAQGHTLTASISKKTAT